MKRIFILFCLMQLCIVNLCAQMTINEVNHRLETRPYFDIYLDYKADIILPDSVQIKMVSALKRILPQHFADSVFTMSEAVLKNIEEYAWRQCRKDTACFEKTYAERYEMNIEFNKKNYANRCYSRSFVLACGSWDIKEAIPYLKKELQDKKCEYMHVEIEMALAKLNDSIKQALIDRYTLANLLESSQLDTIDNNAPIYNLKYTWSHYNGLQTAVYFKSKEMILNILDLIYIKGISMGSIGDDEYYIPAVSDFLNCFQCFGYFHSVPNRNVLWDICDNYRSVLGSYEDKKPTKKEIKRMEKLLSTAYRTKIKEQIRDWIIENVNFE